MKKILLFSLLIIVLVSLPLLTACKGTEPSPTTTPQPTISPTPTPETHWWDEYGENPQYGGELNVYSRGTIPKTFDPNQGFFGNQVLYEQLLWFDWTQDREEWPNTSGLIPEKYMQGWLAESWEWTDPQTLVVKIHEGVHWHNKPPVNGRELVADDIVQHHHRLGGIGSGYTEPSPFVSVVDIARWDEIKAIDDHTVVFTFKEPSIILNFWSISGTLYGVGPPELAKAEGGYGDWKTAIGTGPFLLTDMISETSMSLTKNPDYWGYDERHPENKLPYVDTYNVIHIADLTTAIAALRTGKIDYVDGLDTVQGDTLAQSNPDIVLGAVPQNGWAIDIRCDKEPFNDIRVRKALQMAIDFPTLVESYYEGKVPEDPCGFINPSQIGYCVPYDEWPEELKEEYSYNPERARELLAEAGYPNGFQTSLLTSSGGGPVYDLALMEVAKSYFADIGIDVEIQTMEYSAFNAFVGALKHEAMAQTFFCGVMYLPARALDLSYSKGMRNYIQANDPYYDSIVDGFNSVMTEEEAMEAVRTADMYAIEQHWRLAFPLRIRVDAFQPYIRGYWPNEYNLEHFQAARVWIDADVKKAMGY